MKISDLFTENDGVSLCPARLIALGAFLTMIYKAVAVIAPLDYQAFALGISAIIAAIGYNKREEK
jgi:hypothetical protein